MKTGGYGVLVEINERLVNHLLAAAYYSEFYTAFEGTVVPKTGTALGDLARVDYRIDLVEPPFIDFIPKDKAKVRLSLKAVIKVIGRKVRTDLTVDLLGRMSLDPGKKEVSMEVLEIKLGELRLLDRFELPKAARKIVNEALTLAIHSSFAKGANGVGGPREVIIPITSAPENIRLGEEIRISLLPGFPGMTLKIPSVEIAVSSMVPAHQLDLGEVDMAVFPGYFEVISEHSIALAIAMEENVVGDPADIEDFTEGNDLAIGLSEASIDRMLDQVWPQIPRDVKVNGSIPVDDVRELLDTLRGIKDIPSRFEALGLTQKNTEVEDAWVDFSAIIDPQKPKFRIGRDGSFEIFDTRAKAKAQAVVRATEVTTTQKGGNAFLSTWIKPKEQKPPETKRKEVELYSFDSDIDFLLKRAVVGLVVDEEGRLKVNVTDIDFSLDIPWRLPKFVIEGISNRIEERIKEDFPPIDLTEIVQQKIEPIFPISPRLKMAKVSSDGSEVLIIGNLEFKDVPKRVVPVPTFVADPRTVSREVHRATCPSVRNIPENVQVGYTSLYDALSDGMKGAKDCLPEYGQGLAEKEPALTLPEIGIPLAAPRKRETPPEEGALQRIPIVGSSYPVVQEVRVVELSQEGAHGTGHEVKCEEDQDRPATGKEDAISPAVKEAARAIDRERNEL